MSPSSSAASSPPPPPSPPMASPVGQEIKIGDKTLRQSVNLRAVARLSVSLSRRLNLLGASPAGATVACLSSSSRGSSPYHALLVHTSQPTSQPGVCSLASSAPPDQLFDREESFFPPNSSLSGFFSKWVDQ